MAQPQVQLSIQLSLQDVVSTSKLFSNNVSQSLDIFLNTCTLLGTLVHFTRKSEHALTGTSTRTRSLIPHSILPRVTPYLNRCYRPCFHNKTNRFWIPLNQKDYHGNRPWESTKRAVGPVVIWYSPGGFNVIYM